MKKEPSKEQILSLIKDDLIVTKLILGLDALGLTAYLYCVNIDKTVFEFMGYDENDAHNDEVYEGYMARSKEVAKIDISSGNSDMDPLAYEIYTYLLINLKRKTQ